MAKSSPPSDATGWHLTRHWEADGQQCLAWHRAERVIIDPEPVDDPNPAMNIGRDRYDQFWNAVESNDMSATEAAEYAQSQGIAPPSDAPGWEVITEAVPNRGSERLVWYRTDEVIINAR